MLACDAFSGADPQVLAHVGVNRTQVIANATAAAPVEFLTDRMADISVHRAIATLEKTAGSTATLIDARHLAMQFFGEAALANVILLGAAWQAGQIPISHAALRRAFELNGVAVAANQNAFEIGRIAMAHPEDLTPPPVTDAPVDLDRRVDFLTQYQNARWARRYSDFVAKTAARETDVSGAPGPLTEAVTRNLFKLMSYKDKYEVARLHLSPAFTDALREEFGSDIQVTHHFAPPLLPAGTDARGYPNKRAFGPWIRRGLPLLAAMKRLRGTWFDPFGYTAERRAERALIDTYLATLTAQLAQLIPERIPAVTDLANLPDDVRGFGPIKEKAMTRMHDRQQDVLKRLEPAGSPPAQQRVQATAGMGT